MKPQLIEYAGWKNCLLLQHQQMDLVITLDVGPRIISCRVAGGPNLFKEFPEELGKTDGKEFMLFGGHRLWHAPEVIPRTYALDFDPVEHSWEAPLLTLKQNMEPETRIQKSLQLDFQHSRHIRINHQLHNHNPWAIELAPWCLTMFAEDGRAIVPQEDFRSHPEHLYPARTLTLWHFTRMNDPRVKWGDRFIELREDRSVQQKIKFGLMNKQRWAAYWHQGSLFIKTFAYRKDASYADLGCNFEAFTMPGFLELESLGPLQTLQPGASIDHEEYWYCWECDQLPKDELELQQALQPYLQQLEYPE
jgi:hypothetical protein